MIIIEQTINPSKMHTDNKNITKIEGGKTEVDGTKVGSLYRFKN